MNTLNNYNFKNKKALIRVDFNVPLDAKKIGSGCGADKEPIIHNSLCTNQFEEVEKGFKNSKLNNNHFAIACTQQIKQFSSTSTVTPGNFQNLF